MSAGREDDLARAVDLLRSASGRIDIVNLILRGMRIAVRAPEIASDVSLMVTDETEASGSIQQALNLLESMRRTDEDGGNAPGETPESDSEKS